MKPDLNDIDALLEQHLPSASARQVETSGLRVLHRLRMREQAAATEDDEPIEFEPVPVAIWQRSAVTWMAVAAVLVIAVGTAIVWQPANRVAVVAAVDTSLSREIDGRTETLPEGTDVETGQPVRTTGDAGAVLTLTDGSSVEMRSHSELSVVRETDGLGIRLHAGSIIVSAAKQHGHLYVTTKDVTVSVVGTVFLVNAETDGSRVGVIEGEVHVREGTRETSLRPGQQVSTSPRLVARPLKEEVAWSRNADALHKILDNFMTGMSLTAGPLRPLRDNSAAVGAVQDRAGAGQSFEEASIRPCDPDNVPAPPAGARGGGANSLQMTPGRLHALCMTLATIVRHAYGYGPADLEFLNPGGRNPGLQLTNVYGLGVEDGKRVRGGPDWVRSEHYTIDAVAADAADAASMMGPMIRALLEKRFQLKVHIETEQIPAWSLTIASNGLKIKPVKTDAVNSSGFVDTTVKDGGACETLPTIPPNQPRIIRPAQPGERQPPPAGPGQPVTILLRSFVDVRRGEKPTCGISVQRNGPNQVVVAGGVTLGVLARNLASPLGGLVVTDKTGNTDKFNFLLEYVRDENTPGPGLLLQRPEPDEPSDVPRGQTIFRALEEQLGLKLESARAPRDFIVIDHVERPTAN